MKIIQIPSVSTIIGAIVGAILTVFAGYGVDYWKGQRFNNKIKNFAKAELRTYKKILNELIEKGGTDIQNIKIQSGSETIRKIRQMMPQNKFIQTNYAKLTAETKSQVFDIDSLYALDEVYRLVGDFEMRQVWKNLVFDYFYATREEINKILEAITIAENSLNKFRKLLKTIFTRKKE